MRWRYVSPDPLPALLWVGVLADQPLSTRLPTTLDKDGHEGDEINRSDDAACYRGRCVVRKGADDAEDDRDSEADKGHLLRVL